MPSALLVALLLAADPTPDDARQTRAILHAALAKHATVSRYTALEAGRARAYTKQAVVEATWMPPAIEREALLLLERRSNAELANLLADGRWPELETVAQRFAKYGRSVVGCVLVRGHVLGFERKNVTNVGSEPGATLCRDVLEFLATSYEENLEQGQEMAADSTYALMGRTVAAIDAYMSAWARLTLRRALIQSLDRRSEYLSVDEVDDLVQQREFNGDASEPAEEPAEAPKMLIATTEIREDGSVLTLRVPHFYPGLAADVRLLTLGAGDVDAIVLDLRGSPGGRLAEAVELAQAFSHERVLIEVVGREQTLSMSSDTSERLSTQVPLMVLVDGKTASAAETTAALLQDLGRAVVVGPEATYGKGTAQAYVPVGEGMLRLTTGFVRLPGGRYLECVGVQPDVLAGVAVSGPRECDEPQALRPPSTHGDAEWPRSVLARRARLQAIAKKLSTEGSFRAMTDGLEIARELARLWPRPERLAK
jgi:hypothetical protein